MSEKKRYLVTSALPYANGPAHIGHVAGAYLPADIYVRYLRASGKDVAFICGSDEHGAAITLRAKKEGKNPEDIINKYHSIIKDSFEKFGISFDLYHRTSEKLHHETAQDFFTVLNNKGAFEQKKTEQFFDEEHQQFLADRYIKGTCPNCQYEEAFGDQCERCGTSLSPKDLINPVSMLSDQKPVLKETSHWYLPMQDHEAWLSEWLEKGILDGKEHHDPKEWKKHVIGQCKSWIDGGLHPRAMTRDLDWGVPVPLRDADGKVLYVWMDAPIGYISATKEWAKQNNKNWEDYWRNEESGLIHFIGKDNIVFHCIIFPILLKEYGNFNLPINVPANEFLNLEGEKISTSRNWAIWLHEYLADYPDKVDELRYVLSSILPESKDSEFTWKDYQARVNNELVGTLGNFVNRVFVLVHKYFDGVLPKLSEPNDSLEKSASDASVNVDRLIQKFRFREALQEVMVLARAGNLYLAEEEPWKKIKSDEEAVKNILNNAVQICAHLAANLKPFLPGTAQKIEEMLNSKIAWDDRGKFELVVAGTQFAKPSLLFQKIEDEWVDKEIEKLNKKAPKEVASKFKPMINFEDFSKVDIRAGEIIAAERMESAKKLLKLAVDVGSEKRTILSGIAEQYEPEKVIGQRVCVVANLAPKKMRGVESQGMILMGEDESGNLSFVDPGAVPNGSEIS